MWGQTSRAQVPHSPHTCTFLRWSSEGRHNLQTIDTLQTGSKRKDLRQCKDYRQCRDRLLCKDRLLCRDRLQCKDCLQCADLVMVQNLIKPYNVQIYRLYRNMGRRRALVLAKSQWTAESRATWPYRGGPVAWTEKLFSLSVEICLSSSRSLECFLISLFFRFFFFVLLEIVTENRYLEPLLRTSESEALLGIRHSE